MQECAGAQSGFVREGEKREARADAGAEDAEAVVALRFEPAERAADIEDGLAIRLDA